MEKTDSSPLSRQALYADKKQWNQFLSVFFIGSGRWFYSGRHYLLFCLQLG